MKKIVVALSLILVLGGCNSIQPNISEKEVRSIVMKEHENSIGEVEIISVQHNWREYIVEWENTENCEAGTDYIHDATGKVKKSEVSIC
ncbi:membrane lipoprotein lipid attachment site-containing protein [Rossellomorea marisflavi]|uniref:membrane lipoprotein lipid attachment site-containing protein n=1 Tax=Rossellomorea marisflavi TaxID=189381 RepID=UPI003AED3A8D